MNGARDGFVSGSVQSKRGFVFWWNSPAVFLFLRGFNEKIKAPYKKGPHKKFLVGTLFVWCLRDKAGGPFVRICQPKRISWGLGRREWGRETK